MDFASLLAIRGSSPQNAFADTISNEIHSLWPELSDSVITHLQSAVWDDEEIWTPCMIDPALDLQLLFQWGPRELKIIAAGQTPLSYGKRIEAVVSFVQHVCWLSIVLSASPFGAPAKAIVTQPETGQRNRLAKATLAFELDFLPFTKEEAAACWLGLFPNPVLATGFLAPQRHERYIGLEMSLEFLADICGARHIVEYAGGVVIKGFSVMLLPTGYDESHSLGKLDTVLSLESRSCIGARMDNSCRRLALETYSSFSQTVQFLDIS